MNGFLFEKKTAIDTVRLGDYTLICKHDYTLCWSPKTKDEEWTMTGGLIIQTGTDEFTVAGTGIVITCTSDRIEIPNAGILQLDEGTYVDGKWKPEQRMNGGQEHQERHIRILAFRN